MTIESTLPPALEASPAVVDVEAGSPAAGGEGAPGTVGSPAAEVVPGTGGSPAVGGEGAPAAGGEATSADVLAGVEVPETGPPFFLLRSRKYLRTCYKI